MFSMKSRSFQTYQVQMLRDMSKLIWVGMALFLIGAFSGFLFNGYAGASYYFLSLIGFAALGVMAFLKKAIQASTHILIGVAILAYLGLNIAIPGIASLSYLAFLLPVLIVFLSLSYWNVIWFGVLCLVVVAEALWQFEALSLSLVAQSHLPYLFLGLLVEFAVIYYIKSLIYQEKSRLLSVQKHLQRTIDLIDDAVPAMHLDQKGLVIKANHAWYKLMGGLTQRDVKGLHFSELNWKPEKGLMWDGLSAKWEAILTGTRRNGTEYWVQAKLQEEVDFQYEKTGYIVWFDDVTEAYILGKSLHHDPVTGVVNKRLLDEFTEQAISTFKRYKKEPISFMIVSLDNYESIRDSKGQGLMDGLLKQFTQLSMDLIRGSDVLARWSEDEFVILMRNTDIEGAERLAEKLRDAIQNYQFIDDHELIVSFGLTEMVKSDDAYALFERFDRALYQAKAKGHFAIESVLN